MPTYKYSKIILTKSGVSLKEPNSADLDYGELAINYKDGKLFFKDDNNVIKTIASGGDLTNLIDHRNDQTSNPHGVTAADVGLGSVDNTPDTDKPLSTNDEAALNRLGTSIIGLSTDDWFLADANPNLGAFTGGIITDNGTIKSALQDLESEVVDGNNNLSTHTSNGANPHSVTAAQLGLGNVENKSSATIRSEIVDSNIPSTITRDSELTTHTSNSNNPHYVTAAQLGLVIGTDVQAYSSVLQGMQQSFTTSLKDKLDGIEAGATTDQTGGQIKALYESEEDTNVFTDAEKTLLGNQSGTNTGDQDLTGLQDKLSEGAFVDGDKDKLDNTVEVTGVTNIVSLSQGAYDALTPDATTFYIIV